MENRCVVCGDIIPEGTQVCPSCMCKNVKTGEKRVKSDDDLKKNGEGYSDPTAYKAIKHSEKERERLTKLMHVIFDVCEFAGFHIEGRITLRDKKTGKLYR